MTLLIDPITGAKQAFWGGFVPPERFLEEVMPHLETPPSSAAGPHKRHKPVGTAKPPPPPAAPAPRSEEDDLAAAIAASLGALPSDGAGPMPLAPPMAPPPPPEFAWCQPGAAVAGAAAMAAAAAALPVETAGGCRMALRLPDGSRAVRFFATDTPLAVLHTWAAASVSDAALGRPFVLATPGTGLLDAGAGGTLAEAGLANALLVMSWAA